MKANDLFDTITDQLVADIEAGAGTWRMPWHSLADAGTPTSVDGRPYRGMNALWLPMVSAANGWASGVWATFRGWQRQGAQVRRGERGTHVILWKPTNQTDTPSDNDATDEAGQPRRQLLARAYCVFAAEQADGAEPILERRANEFAQRDTPERIDAADAFFAAVGARMVTGGNRSCYEPGTDTIRLPDLAQFDHAAAYYATSAHEHVHWTGHPDRLARDLTGRFGSDAYAAEELVAELGAAMWCAQADISATTRADHAAYLAGWLRVLRTDARALVTVAARAQAAVDHLTTLAGLPTEVDAREEASGAA
ncbi:MAG: ArdC family protein [Acidimicrobiia bacterium]